MAFSSALAILVLSRSLISGPEELEPASPVGGVQRAEMIWII